MVWGHSGINIRWAPRKPELHVYIYQLTCYVSLGMALDLSDHNILIQEMKELAQAVTKAES